MKYSIAKIYSFACLFEKKAQTTTNSSSLREYVERGLADLSAWQGKVAKEGRSITGKAYPAGYIGGFNPDHSGLPTGFDDDVPLDNGMNKEQVQTWVLSYFGETDPSLLLQTAAGLTNFPIASKILKDKAEYIRRHTKVSAK